MKIEHHNIIDAPLGKVWQATIDIDRWAEWTPTVEHAKRLDEGEFRVGSQARIKQPGAAETVWIVTECTPGKSFSWEAKLMGIPMVATHELSEVEGGTQNLLRVEASGLMARLLWPVLRPKIQKALEQEAAGLKEFCENELSGKNG